MPTFKDQVTQTVDELIQQGVIARDMRDQYINLMAANDAVAERFGGMLMRGSDYTRKTQEVAEQRRQLQATQDAERAKLASDRTALEQWQRQAQAKLAEADALGKQLPELAAKVAAYEQILADYNLQDQVKLSSPSYSTPAPAAHTPAPAGASPVSGGQWLSREEGIGALRELLEQQQQMAIIQARHAQLFGAPLLDPVLTEAMNANQRVEDYWRAKYNVAGKEAELAQKQRDQEVAAMREQLRAELQAEYASDPNRLIGGPSPLGGLTKSQLLDTYAASKALAASPLNQAPEGGASSLPPEQRPDIAASRARLDAATAMFAKNFSPDGRPLTEDARALAAAYSQ